MGTVHPDRVPIEVWRESFWTVGDMIRGRWRVEATCPVCDLTVRVKLRVMATCLGPGWFLWGRTLPCPRVYCTGKMGVGAWPPNRTAGSLPLDVSAPVRDLEPPARHG